MVDIYRTENSGYDQHYVDHVNAATDPLLVLLVLLLIHLTVLYSAISLRLQMLTSGGQYYAAY